MGAGFARSVGDVAECAGMRGSVAASAWCTGGAALPSPEIDALRSRQAASALGRGR
jgi:hypothetical protein